MYSSSFRVQLGLSHLRFDNAEISESIVGCVFVTLAGKIAINLSYINLSTLAVKICRFRIEGTRVLCWKRYLRVAYKMLRFHTVRTFPPIITNNVKRVGP